MIAQLCSLQFLAGFNADLDDLPEIGIPFEDDEIEHDTLAENIRRSPAKLHEPTARPGSGSSPLWSFPTTAQSFSLPAVPIRQPAGRSLFTTKVPCEGPTYVSGHYFVWGTFTNAFN